MFTTGDTAHIDTIFKLLMYIAGKERIRASVMLDWTYDEDADC
jgi:hypothetical protein